MSIKSWRDRDLEAIFDQRTPGRRFPSTLIGQVRRKLVMLNNALTPDDLRHPAGNRLEALRGDRAGQFSVRVNDQYRICFGWDEGGPTDVEFVDYH